LAILSDTNPGDTNPVDTNPDDTDARKQDGWFSASDLDF